MARARRRHDGRPRRRTGRGRISRARDAWACRGPHRGPAGRPLGAPRAVSLIAIHQHGIPDRFPRRRAAGGRKRAGPARLARARTCATCRWSPSTRRCARPRRCGAGRTRPDPRQPRRHVLWVAIADVAHYVRPGRRWTARRASAAIPPISPTAWCRCCPTGCRATCARCTKGWTAPALRCACASTRRAQRSATALRARADAVAGVAAYEQVQAAMDGAPDTATAPCWTG
jgi:ribonuclease R